MPKRLINEILLSELGHYQLWEEVDHVASFKRIEPDTPEYFTWLSGLRSFHFEGKEGRLTARLEARKNKDGSTRQYWSAYRKHNKQQFRRYLGQTNNLTIATLEDAAQHLTDVCNSQPAKIKTPRKRPESRTILYARIKIQEEAINQLLADKEVLEQELTALKIERARWIVQSREREF
jgi:hypothetical protein